MTDGGRDTASLLRQALDGVADTRPAAQVTASVERLIARYRSGGAATTPILRDPVDVLAYALYRMPATYAAVAAALEQATLRWGPAGPGVRSVLDLGGGTGAAAWAATAVWPHARVQVLDQVDGCLELGRRLAGSELPVTFGRWRLGEGVPDTAADVVTASYVLSELTEPQQRAIVDHATGPTHRAVLVIEPGTPDGYARVLRARERVLARGWHLVAPCPHDAVCPLAGHDWCHFAARVDRSAIHRRLKQGSLGHEDEKFSYVFAVAPGETLEPAEPRVIRHPVKRKGLVELQLCRPDTTAGQETVSKRHGTAYKRARSVSWGETYTTP